MSKNKKINVLFVIIQLGMGGSEKVVFDLIRNLDSSRFNIFLAYFFKGHMEKDFKEICPVVVHIPKKDGFDLSAMLRINRIIQEHEIDVINAHHYMPFFYSFLGSTILNKRKLVYTEHSVPEVEAILSSKHKYLLRLLLRNTNQVVCISNAICEVFRHAFPRKTEKFRAIANGVDIDHFITSIDRDMLRSKWGILPSHFVIGTVANFRKVKNHACLIKALDHLQNEYPFIRSILVGQGFAEDTDNSKEEVLSLIKAYGLEERVILTGYQKDIPSLLKTFDLFCLPSFSEGLPVCVLEAMSAGVPIVGSDVQGINEIVFSEKTGILYPSNDDYALANVLERLVNDSSLRRSISDNAFSYVKQKHGIHKWVSEYERLFSINNS
jgi:L-malate glycosyltransferase